MAKLDGFCFRCMGIFCPASWLPLYYLTSTWLDLPPTSTCSRP